jgi:trans-2,3-dihydro-3-hydroxyanthranilate isomerase
MSRLYVILDVFTDRALAGNPLAVVMDSQGLDDAGMQRIAREFNLSETVFLLPAEDEARKARLRIFTPQRELPFAGHPTIGTAVLLGLMDAAAGKRGEIAFEVEEEVGAVACRVEAQGRRAGRARFTLPRPPAPAGAPPESYLVAAALGLTGSDIGFDDHRISRFSAGNAFCFVPVRGLEALGRVRAEPSFWNKAFAEESGRAAAFVYTRETGDPAHAFRARMLHPGIGEDPATGSAVAAFAGAIMAFERPADGSHSLVVEQGFEMGRPSLIELGLEVEGRALLSATIGGSAVVVAEGTLFS